MMGADTGVRVRVVVVVVVVVGGGGGGGVREFLCAWIWGDSCGFNVSKGTIGWWGGGVLHTNAA